MTFDTNICKMQDQRVNNIEKDVTGLKGEVSHIKKEIQDIKISQVEIKKDTEYIKKKVENGVFKEFSDSLKKISIQLDFNNIEVARNTEWREIHKKILISVIAAIIGLIFMSIKVLISEG